MVMKDGGYCLIL
jgi:hypothetical protein